MSNGALNLLTFPCHQGRFQAHHTGESFVGGVGNIEIVQGIQLPVHKRMPGSA